MQTSVRSVGWLLLWCGAAACTGAVYRDLEPALDAYEARPQSEVRAWYLRAAVAEHRGDTDEADAAWKWVLRLEDSGWTRLGHAAYLERQGRWDEAVDAYRLAVRHDGALAEAHLGIGRVLVGRGDDPSAEAALLRAGPLPEALHLLGRLYLRQGDQAAAARVYEAWAGQEASNPETRLGRARLAAAVGLHHEAVDDLVVALESHTASPVTGSLLVDEARRSCRIGTAWGWARDRAVADRSDPGWRQVALEIGLAARDPDMVEAAVPAGDPGDLLAERMELLARAGRIDDALALASSASAARPDDPEPAIRAGRLLADQGQHEMALSAWQGVDGPVVALDRAGALLALGRLEASMAVLDGLDGNRAAWLRGRVLVARGELDAAEAQVRDLPDGWRLVASLRHQAADVDGALQALAEAGDDPRALRDAGRWAEQAGRPMVALDAWRALVAVDPGDAHAWVAVARLDPDAAEHALGRALVADPCSVDALVALAGAPNACDAIGPLERATEVAPLDADVLRRLGDAYHGCGRIEGMRWVERTWRVLGDEEAAERMATLRREIEP